MNERFRPGFGGKLPEASNEPGETPGDSVERALRGEESLNDSASDPSSPEFKIDLDKFKTVNNPRGIDGPPERLDNFNPDGS